MTFNILGIVLRYPNKLKKGYELQHFGYCKEIISQSDGVIFLGTSCNKKGISLLTTPIIGAFHSSAPTPGNYRTKYHYVSSFSNDPLTQASYELHHALDWSLCLPPPMFLQFTMKVTTSHAIDIQRTWLGPDFIVIRPCFFPLFHRWINVEHVAIPLRKLH